jgi:transposase
MSGVPLEVLVDVSNVVDDAAPAAVVAAVPKPKRKNNAKLRDDQREQIVSLWVNHDQSAREIRATLLHRVSLAAVYGVIKAFKKRGHCQMIPPKVSSNRAFPQEVKEFFVKAQEEKPDATLKDLRYAYFYESGDFVSTTTISRYLKDEDFTTKKLYIEPAPRNTPELILERCIYSQEMISYEEGQLIFIDESGFNLWMRRGRGRAKKGKRVIVRVPKSKGANITVIGAISPRYGLLHSEVRLGSTSGDVFATFIQDLLKQPRLQVATHIIVMDNASIHKTEAVRAAFTEARVAQSQRYLPAYSPQLNPIEECWSKVQKYVVSHRQETTPLLMDVVRDALKTVTPADCAGWYRHSVRFYVECAASKPLE